MTTSWATHDPTDVEGLRRLNQRDRVREILRSAGKVGVCTLQWNALGLPNARNRCYELRDDEGLVIDNVPCDLERFHAQELREARGRDQEFPAHRRFIWYWNGHPLQLALRLR